MTNRLAMGPEALTYQETTQGELRRLTRSQGELRMAMDAMKRELLSIIERLSELERARQLVGGIQGLEGEWTVTPPPEWDEG